MIAVITGGTKRGVSAAGRRINLIVTLARQKQQFTHFLSIPIIADSIRRRFMQFKVNTI
jgi:activating signal cointegrator complex subunit 1